MTDDKEAMKIKADATIGLLRVQRDIAKFHGNTELAERLTKSVASLEKMQLCAHEIEAAEENLKIIMEMYAIEAVRNASDDKLADLRQQAYGCIDVILDAKGGLNKEMRNVRHISQGS